jgi:hypothetical protein
MPKTPPNKKLNSIRNLSKIGEKKGVKWGKDPKIKLNLLTFMFRL